jgi:tyrosine-protein kinase
LEIKEYLRIFRRYWIAIVLLTILGAGIGYATILPITAKIIPFIDERQYQSTATLFVATQNGTSVSEAYQNNLFSQDRVNSYAGLATSEQVAARAVDQLKSPISAGELRGKVSALPREKTVLLDVKVKDPDPAKAQTYANAVADQLVNVVSEVETSRRGGTPTAAAIIVDDADYPTTPIGMKLWLRITLGAVGGLAVGILLAICAAVLDKRLRARDSVESETGELVIGGLPLDDDRAKANAVDLAGAGLYPERLRELRTNLRFAIGPDGDPPRMIVVTSPSTGDGRTVTAIDLAAALAETGRSVVLVDGDLRTGAMAGQLDLGSAMSEAAGSRGLSTFLIGEHGLADALIDGVDLNGETVTYLPAGPTPPRPGELWAADRVSTLFRKLRETFDYVIVDTPPLSDYSDGVIAVAHCDGALVLTRIGHTTSKSLRRAIQVLDAANATIIGTVVTCEPVTRIDARRHRNKTEAADLDNGGAHRVGAAAGGNGTDGSEGH